MKVLPIKEGSKVQPNTVYVIPPNTNISIKKGILHLVKQEHPHYTNLPINTFFESLAEDRKEHAIAIVLSGSGSDGALGVKAIKIPVELSLLKIHLRLNTTACHKAPLTQDLLITSYQLKKYQRN